MGERGGRRRRNRSRKRAKKQGQASSLITRFVTTPHSIPPGTWENALSEFGLQEFVRQTVPLQVVEGQQIAANEDGPSKTPEVGAIVHHPKTGLIGKVVGVVPPSGGEPLCLHVDFGTENAAKSPQQFEHLIEAAKAE
jgi:hypothetical protein